MAVAQQVSHVFPLGSRVNEAGRLEVGGCDLVELAREVGTPAYVVAEDDLRARARSFLAAFAAHGAQTDVHFAAKAFPVHGRAASCSPQEGLACDVAGRGELERGAARGLRPVAHPRARQRQDARTSCAGRVQAGVGHVVLDNADEIDRLERIVPAGARQRVQMRIAPGVSPDTHPAISTGGPNTKFGFSLADAPAAIARVQASGAFELEGLHFHIGSQILDLAPFRAALAAIAPLGRLRRREPRRRPRRGLHARTTTRPRSRSTPPRRCASCARSSATRCRGSSTSPAARSWPTAA